MTAFSRSLPLFGAIAALSAAPCVHAQDWLNIPVAFLIGPNSVNIGRPSSTPGQLIDSGILLTPNSPPGPVFAHNFLLPSFGPTTAPFGRGRIPGGPPNGSAPTWANDDEVDALSMISWRTWFKVRVVNQARWLFSVTAGSTGVAAITPNDLLLEAAGFQGHADIFQADVPQLFLPITTPPIGNLLSIDGNGGLNGPPDFGFGLVERPAANDELSCFSIVANSLRQLYFHSLSRSHAAAYGYSGAHVFWRNPVTFTVLGNTVLAGTYVYLLPSDLGLTFADDVDALVVHENKITGFQRTGGLVLPDGTIPIEANGDAEHLGVAVQPFTGAFTSDQIFFSVTPDSPIVGTLDSALGQPINPGDILTTPASPGLPPRIVVLGELLGLRTVRIAPFDINLMDDIDALDNIPIGYYDETQAPG
ncbi:MAG: hypothetical protein JNM84_10010 [Planctomycetes bacterium]|nr:hypothetical protein [Planctomycetota bacterium]